MMTELKEIDILVNVRWFDGYLESYNCTEVRAGCDLLWLRLVEGSNQHIPLKCVRWYSLNPESHEIKGRCKEK